MGKPRDWAKHRHRCLADRGSSWVATDNCPPRHLEYVVVGVVIAVTVAVVVAVPKGWRMAASAVARVHLDSTSHLRHCHRVH